MGGVLVLITSVEVGRSEGGSVVVMRLLVVLVVVSSASSLSSSSSTEEVDEEEEDCGADWLWRWVVVVMAGGGVK
jgi:hypothetical protein